MALDRALTNRELASALELPPATVLHHVRTLVATGFLAQEAWRSGPRGSTEKPYRATGKSARVEIAGTESRANLHQAMLQAVAAEIDDAGSEAVIESARLPLRLRPDQVGEVTVRINALIDSYRDVDEYLGADASDGDHYALLVILHRR